MDRAFTIKKLTPADLPEMRALNTCFGRVFNDWETYQGKPPGDDYLVTLLNSEAFIALVCCDQGELIGGLAAYVLPKFEQARSEIYIYDLAVDAGFRRRGIATALIRELQALARARQAWVTFVQADYGDQAAIALYNKLGIREAVLHFDLTQS